MSKYRKEVEADAQKFLEKTGKKFNSDKGEHGGKSNVPNLSLWLDENGLLAKHVETLSQKWAKKDLLRINDNSRNNTPYGDPRDSAFNAYYKDMLFELKKLIKKT